MATCLVNITGTSGEVLITYTDSGAVNRYVKAGLGSLYLDDSGSDYIWQTLSGDAVVASGCISFTENATSCYLLTWERLVTAPNVFLSTDLKFKSVVLGSSTYNLSTPVPYPRSCREVGDLINKLNLSNIKAVSFKEVSSTKTEYFLVLQVTGADVPFLKIVNSEENHFLYIKGEPEGSPVPVGYTQFEVCQVGTIAPL